MGQKTHPTSYRLGVIYGWKSAWFHKQKYADYLLEDIKIRRLLTKKLKEAGVARIEIERTEKETRINIYSSRPGIIIGRGGTGIEELKKFIKKNIHSLEECKINIEEVREPNANARLVALNVAEQLEKRVSFRRALKQAIERTYNTAGVEGVKIMVAGRLNGAEMSRREWLGKGRMPLHTLRADIDFAHAEALTTYGILGVKVWIYRGDVFEEKKQGEVKQDEKNAQNSTQDRKKASQNHSLHVK
jgi:small subunit ribosomal protein S3